MRIKVRGTDTGAAVDIITPGEGGPGTDQIVQTIEVGSGNELLVNIPAVTDPSGLEYGNVVSASGEPAPAAPTPEGGVGGGNEGSSTGGTTETGEGDQPEAPAQGDTSGQGGEAPAAVTGTATPATSAASEKPLYLVEASDVPPGFEESGLETPDGKTLFHFGEDVAEGPSTGNADGVSVYAESAENDKPVVATTPAA